MKKLVIVLSLLVVISCGKKSEPVRDKGELLPTIEKKQAKNLAPDFTLSDINGKTVSLKDFRGNAVLLIFWATWCPACRSKIPDLKEIYEKSRDQGISLIAVSVDNNLDKLKRFIKKNNIKYTVLFDKNAETAKLYSVTGIPAHFVVDKDGFMFSFGPNISAAKSKLEKSL